MSRQFEYNEPVEKRTKVSIRRMLFL